MSKSLMIFRLHDLTYSKDGHYGNKESLRVSVNENNELHYSLYGSWQPSGIPFSISNLQLKESLPVDGNKFLNLTALRKKIEEILKTGCGSNNIYEVEELNKLPTKTKKPFETLMYGEKFYPLFKEAVEITERETFVQNLSITFNDKKRTVQIRDTKADFLINVGRNYQKLISKML